MSEPDVKIDEIGKITTACEENLKMVQNLSEHIESLYEKLLPVRRNLLYDIAEIGKEPPDSKSAVRAMIEESSRKIGVAIAFLNKIYEEVEV